MITTTLCIIIIDHHDRALKPRSIARKTVRTVAVCWDVALMVDVAIIIAIYPIFSLKITKLRRNSRNYPIIIISPCNRVYKEMTSALSYAYLKKPRLFKSTRHLATPFSSVVHESSSAMKKHEIVLPVLCR